MVFVMVGCCDCPPCIVCVWVFSVPQFHCFLPFWISGQQYVLASMVVLTFNSCLHFSVSIIGMTVQNAVPAFPSLPCPIK